MVTVRRFKVTNVTKTQCMVRGGKNELLPADKVMQNVGHLNKNNEIHFVSNFSGKKNQVD